MANSADVVEVFECEGSFSFLHELHRFTFKIYKDCSLCIDIRPVTATTLNSLEASDQETLNEDNVTTTKLVAYDGRALVDNNGHEPTCYMVHYKLVQWVPGMQTIQTQIVKCIARLSRKQGLFGRFVDIQESMEEAQDFVLKPIAHRFESLDNVLQPLTPGRYELRGITIAENSFAYECDVEFTLLADGMVSGVSREQPFAQECLVAGMWTRLGLTYLLEYEMYGHKHSYIYYGTPFHSCLHGTWENVKLHTFGIYANSQAEHGILELHLVKAVRVWSEAYHKDYPATFKECVTLLLLASYRDGILPNHLWRSVFVYCGYDWFRSGFVQLNSYAMVYFYTNQERSVGSGIIMDGRSHVSVSPGQLSTPSLPPLERVYDGCVGGFLAEKSRILLRIESDGTVHGEVRRRQGASSRILANEKNRKRRIVANHPDGIVIAHIIGNAQVVPIEEAVVLCSSTVRGDGTSAAEYCCVFEITKRLNHVDRHTLTCHLHVPIASNVPAVGTWRFFSARNCTLSSAMTSNLETPIRMNEAGSSLDQKVFQLQPVQWYQRQQEAEQEEREAALMQSRLPSLLYPLRPGRYEFKGFTTNDTSSVVTVPRQRNGRRGRSRSVVTTLKDECLVTLHLLPDGTLRGTSREVVQPQVCLLTGRWQANRVAYVLEYHVREAVGHFRYSGAVVIEKDDTTINGNEKANFERRETLSGKWYNVDEGHAAGFEGGRGKFELELVRVTYTPVTIKEERALETRERQSKFIDLQSTINNASRSTSIEVDDNDDVLRALTSGEYELSGCATDAEGYEYAFHLQLQLHPNGKLFGQCKERIFHQISPVSGRWNPSRIVYSQQYVVKHEVGMYTYAGDMSEDGAVIRGMWTNIEDEAALALSEHGTFALILVNVKRQWSAFSHVNYPPRFRRGVLTTLMASAKSNQLPGALWTHIFAFCSEQWFTPVPNVIK